MNKSSTENDLGWSPLAKKKSIKGVMSSDSFIKVRSLIAFGKHESMSKIYNEGIPSTIVGHGHGYQEVGDITAVQNRFDVPGFREEGNH